jgi:hypothetical protein
MNDVKCAVTIGALIATAVALWLLAGLIVRDATSRLVAG